MQDIKNNIRSYVEARREQMLEDLIRLCRIPSTAQNPAALSAAASEVAAALASCGASPRIFEIEGGAPIVYGEIGSGERTLLVYNHYDVQPADPLDLWRTDPFTPTIEGDAFYCRGASDNKGNFMARVHAVRALQAATGKLPVRIKFLIEGEEETSSAHLGAFVREHRELLKADGCLWECSWKDPRGRPILTCGLKGLCYVELRARGARHDMHSSYAAIVPNPAWRLVWALATLLDSDYRITIPGWTDEIRPPDAAASRALDRVQFDEEAFRTLHGVHEFVRRLSGRELVRQFLSCPTVTICGLRAGYTGEGAKTVLPAEAVAKLDFRLVPDMTPKKLLAALRRHLDRRGFRDIEIKEFGGVMPAATSCDDRLVRAAAAAVRMTAGVEPIIYPVAPWSGPLYDVCGVLGIPSVAFGVGHADSCDHAPNENISMDDYFEGVRCMAAFLGEYAAIP
ncbi:MAG: M20/M25/M40 family metallo-hydrolase [Candidatus Aureabacteria bacterium]|nr:M20/M25/M40 family metallo-hydrolase [Candidatus Auribacterota bacterium]